MGGSEGLWGCVDVMGLSWLRKTQVRTSFLKGPKEAGYCSSN